MRLKSAGRFADLRDAVISAAFWSGIPTALCAIYLYGFSVNQYVSEAQFVVRGDTVYVSTESSGTLGNLIAINTSQDTRIAADFLASGAVLSDLRKKFDLGSIFASRGLDVLAGLSPGATAEEIVDYWHRAMSSEVDVVSGIVTAKLRTFSAEEARTLLEAAIQATEAKLNALHRRALEGASQAAVDRAKAARARLKQAREELRSFRDRYRAIDARAGAASTFELLAELRRRRMENRADLAVMRAQGVANAPGIKALEARIAGLDQQIAALERELTGAIENDTVAATALIEVYDRLILQQDMASQHVARTSAAAAKAELKLGSRQVYLDVFAPAAVAEASTYPHRLQVVLTVLAAALAMWGLARLIWAGIRSHSV